MILDISKLDVYIVIIINAIFTGLGTALGTYIAQNHLIESMRKIFRRKK